MVVVCVGGKGICARVFFPKEKGKKEGKSGGAAVCNSEHAMTDDDNNKKACMHPKEKDDEWR